MYLAYFDESGDTGLVGTSPSVFYVIACVLVRDAQWNDALNLLVRIRRRMKTKFGIPTIPEIKATDFRKGQGPLVHLGWSVQQRSQLFCQLLAWEHRLNLQTFAIAIDKRTLHAGRNPREVAWQYTLQRVDSFCRHNGEMAMLFPDAGHGFFIRKMVRRLRRFQLVAGRFGGTLNIRAERIIEDPNDRHSQDSYFIQLADWNAYAAHRSHYLDPRLAEFAHAWDQLQHCHLLAVNRLRLHLNPPPAIVRYL
jgi:hypothetical protein